MKLRPNRLHQAPATYLMAWFTFRVLFKAYFRWQIYNVEHVPLEGGVIIASNHASYVDPPLIGTALWRHVNFLAREDLFSIPVVGWLLRDWEVVPVDRDGGGAVGLRAILDRLLAGRGIVLFPEGTRTRDGKLQPVRSGIGLTVIKSTAPVVPVRIFGSYEAYGRHRLLPRPYHIALKFGQPMRFEQLRSEAKVCTKPRLKQIYQQVANEIMAAVARLEPYEDKAQFP
jgi:1-acyl-sn-glycerol-3-phosphate acyltransferase